MDLLISINPNVYNGAALSAIRRFISDRLALLIRAHISNKDESFSKNSSLFLEVIAKRGKLPVTTPRLPIFVEPDPNELKYSFFVPLLNLPFFIK